MDSIMLDNVATHALKHANDTCQDLTSKKTHVVHPAHIHVGFRKQVSSVCILDADFSAMCLLCMWTCK